MATMVKVGSISHGATRPQDLIPRFLDALRTYAPAAYAQVITAPLPVIPSDAQIDEDHPWWDSEAASSLVDELIDALNDHAPDGYYFGAHEGDGSDYGFWVYDTGY